MAMSLSLMALEKRHFTSFLSNQARVTLLWLIGAFPVGWNHHPSRRCVEVWEVATATTASRCRRPRPPLPHQGGRVQERLWLPPPHRGGSTQCGRPRPRRGVELTAWAGGRPWPWVSELGGDRGPSGGCASEGVVLVAATMFDEMPLRQGKRRMGGKATTSRVQGMHSCWVLADKHNLKWAWLILASDTNNRPCTAWTSL
jgi:hypothetical protein